ncbi:hypothetical protein J19TS1_53790 [Heyndrickxia oleronia]|nr:hypothetical protein J19TS1_53790 [Heyndrickxia oleronia]
MVVQLSVCLFKQRFKLYADVFQSRLFGLALPIELGRQTIMLLSPKRGKVST